MKKILFRGWNEFNKVWVYGPFSRGTTGLCFIGKVLVNSDSIGIYINKDDNTKWEDRPKEWLHIPKGEWKGVPIFCGCDGAKYGSDIVEFEMSNEELTGRIYWVDDFSRYGIYTKLEGKFFNESILPLFPDIGLKVTSNQWEEHLKDNIDETKK